MSDRHAKGPDESWEAVNKDNTRESASGQDRNKLKPDDARLKDEVTVRQQDDDSDDSE